MQQYGQQTAGAEDCPAAGRQQERHEERLGLPGPEHGSILPLPNSAPTEDFIIKLRLYINSKFMFVLSCNRKKN